MQLNIVYEDADILVCFKQAGVATQTASLSSQDMVSLLKNYLVKEKKEKNPYIGVIHRLDQPVSGLLVFAKNQRSAGILSKQIQDGNANKDYLAICQGILLEKEKELVHYIRKNPETKMAQVLQEMPENAEEKKEWKKAALEYEVLEEREDYSLVKIHLKTGRFHQIRAQFSFVGHPLLGDVKYKTKESEEVSKKHRIRFVALCAHKLNLKHPVSGENMQFILPQMYLPKEMKSTNEK